MAQDILTPGGVRNPNDFSLGPDDPVLKRFKAATERFYQSDLWKHARRQAQRQQISTEAAQLQEGRDTAEKVALQALRGIDVGATKLPSTALGAVATAGGTVRRLGEGLGERRTLPSRALVSREQVEAGGVPEDVVAAATRPREEIPPGPVSRGVAAAGRAVEEGVQPALETANQVVEQLEQEWGDTKPGLIGQLAGQFTETAIVSAPSMVGGFAGARGAATALSAVRAARRSAAGNNLAHFAMTNGEILRAAEAVGMGASMAAGGATSAGMVYNEAVKALMEMGMSEEEARDHAVVPAALSGLSTALWVRAFGKTGVERAVLLKTPKGVFKTAMREVLRQARHEASEEALDEATDSLIAKLTYEPDKTLEEAATEVVLGFFFGGALGAGVTGVMQLAYGRKDRGQEAPESEEGSLTVHPDAYKNPEQLLFNRQPEPSRDQALGTVAVDRERVGIAQSLVNEWEAVKRGFSEGRINEQQMAQAWIQLHDRANQLAEDEDLSVQRQNQEEVEFAKKQELQRQRVQAAKEGKDVPALVAPEGVVQEGSPLGELVKEINQSEVRRAVRTPGALAPQRDTGLERMYRAWIRSRLQDQNAIRVEEDPSELEARIRVAENLQDEIQRFMERAAEKQAQQEPKPDEQSAINTTSPVDASWVLQHSASEISQKAQETNFPGGPSGLAISVGSKLSSEPDYWALKAEYDRINDLMAQQNIPEGMSVDQLVDLGTKASFIGEVLKAADGTDQSLSQYPDYKPPLAHLKGVAAPVPAAEPTPVETPFERSLFLVREAEKRVRAAEDRAVSALSAVLNKEQQIKHLRALETGQKKGEFSTSEYRSRRMKRQAELRDLRKLNVAAKKELAIERQLLTKLQKQYRTDTITLEDLHKGALVIQDLQGARAANIKANTGWTMAKANDVLSRLVDLGVVIRPAKITDPWMLSAKGVSALSPLPVTQTKVEDESAPIEPKGDEITEAERRDIQAELQEANGDPDPIPAPPADPGDQRVAAADHALQVLQSKLNELESELRDEFKKTNFFGSPRAIVLSTQYMGTLFAYGIVRSARVFHIMIRRYGEAIIPYLKQAYIKARTDFVGKLTPDTDEQIDKTLANQSYRYAFGKDDSDIILEETPTKEHLDATMPLMPLGYILNQPRHRALLAQHFWNRIHAAFMSNNDVSPAQLKRDLVGYEVRDSAEMLRLRNRGETLEVIETTRQGSPVAWWVPGEWQRYYGPRGQQPAKQPLMVGRQPASVLYDELFAEYKTWIDAHLHSLNPNGLEEALIARTRIPLLDNPTEENRAAYLKKWISSRTDQMAAMAKDLSVGPESLAMAVGRQLILTESHLADVVNEWRRVRALQQQANADRDVGLAKRNGDKLDLLQVAIEAATGQGKPADILVKDKTYAPNVATNIDFVALQKESQIALLQRMRDPVGVAPRRSGQLKIGSLRTGMIEQFVIENINDPLAASRNVMWHPAEIVYMMTILRLLDKKAPEPIITNTMREQAFDAAKQYGYDPVREQMPKYPRLYGHPAASPVGDRLYRSPVKLKNGVRTVAVEVGGPNGDAVTAATIAVGASIAAQVDHVIMTNGASFVGFRAFADWVTPEQKNAIYAKITLNQDPEYMPLPKRKTTRYHWYGIRDPEKVSHIAEVLDAQVTILDQDEVDSLLSLVDNMEANEVSRMMLRNFIADVEHGNYSVFEKDQGAERVAAYERSTPRFVSQMMNIRERVFFGDTFVRDGVSYQRVSIPGIFTESEIPTDGTINRDEIYARYIGHVADAIAARAVQVMIRDQMGVRTSKLRIYQPSKAEVYTPTPAVGVEVTLKRGGVELPGVITAIRDAAITRRAAPKALDVGVEVIYTKDGKEIPGAITSIQTITTHEARSVKGKKKPQVVEVEYDVYGLSAIVDGKQTKFMKVAASDLRPASQGKIITGIQEVYDVQLTGEGETRIVRSATPDEVVIKPRSMPSGVQRPTQGFKIIEHSTKDTGGVEPEIFDGEPFVNKTIFDIPLRNIAAGSTNKKARGVVLALMKAHHPNKIREMLIKMGQHKRRVLSGKSFLTLREESAITDHVFPGKIEAFNRSDKGQHTALINQLIDRVTDLYSIVSKVADANNRIKNRAGVALLRVNRFYQERAPTTYIQGVERQVRRYQTKPNKQEEYLGLDFNTALLPPADRYRSLRYRIVNHNSFKAEDGWKPDKDLANKLTRVPAGKVIVQVTQEGIQYASTKALLTGEEVEKTVRGTPVMTWIAVDGDNALIQVFNAKTKSYKTVYTVDLNSLVPFGARPFEHVAPKSATKHSKNLVLKGWYLSPEVILNSEKNTRGESRWKKTEKERKQFLSIEDYKSYVGNKIVASVDPLVQGTARDESLVRDPDNLSEVATTETPDAIISKTEAIEGSDIEEGAVATPVTVASTADVYDGVAGLFNQLSKTKEGKALVAELRAGRQQLERDDQWEDVVQRAADILKPGWQQISSDPEVVSFLSAIDDAVQRFRESRVKKEGGMFSVGIEGAPMVRDVDPSLLNRKFRGKQEIREAIANPNNGMSEESRAQALGIIDALPEQMFADLDFEMIPSRMAGAEQRVVYGGSFSHALRLARVVVGSSNTTNAAEELAHSIARFLPDSVSNEVEAFRMIELRKLIENPDTPANVREFAELLMRNGGAITSEHFVGLNRTDWLDLYPLINTDEFFAHNLTDAARKSNQPSGMGKAIDWAINWARDFINSIRAWLGNRGVQRDSFFDNLWKEFKDGKFVASVNGGYLHEVNALSDIGNVAVAIGSEHIKNIAKYEGQRDPVNIGIALMGQVFNLSGIMSRVESQLLAEGEQLSNPASELLSVDNLTNSVRAVRDFFNTGPMDYKSAKSLLTTEAMRNQLSLGAMGCIQLFERNGNRAKNLAKKWADRLASDDFAKLVEGAALLRTKLFSLQTLSEAVDGQLKQAVDAAIKVSASRSASQAQYEYAQREIKYLNTVVNYSPGIAQKMTVISDALLNTDIGTEFMIGSRTLDPSDILQAWLSTNPTQDQLAGSNEVIDAAIFLLARHARIRNELAASMLEQDEATLAAIPGFARTVANAITRKSNAAAIARMFDYETQLARAEAKVAFLLDRRQSKIKRWLNRAAAMDQASRFFDRVTSDPQYIGYREIVARDVGEQHIPNAWRHVGMPRFGKDILLPMPITNQRLTFSLETDKAALAEQQVNAYIALNELEEWLSVPENAEKPEAVYFRVWRDFCEHATKSSEINDFAKTWTFSLRMASNFVDQTSVLIDGILRTKGNIVTQLLNEPLRVWRNSASMMEEWQGRWHDKIKNFLTRAAYSHEEDLDIDTTNPSVAINGWYDSVGRELFALANAGYKFKAGDTLPVSGNTINQSDVDAMKIQVQAIDEAMTLDATHGVTKIVQMTTVEDQLVPGVTYRRKAQKTSDDMLCRVFNHDALMWTKEYVTEGIDKGDLNYKRKKIWDNASNVLMSFLLDRESSYTKDKGMDPIFAAAAEEIRAGRIKSMLDFESFLNANYDSMLARWMMNPRSDVVLDKEATGMILFYDEFDALMQRIHKMAVQPRESEASQKFYGAFHVAQENSFTLGRAQRIAPFYWYNYGFQGEHSLINFRLNGSSYYVQKVIEGFMEVEKMVNAKIDRMRAEIRDLEAKGMSQGEAEIEYGKKNRSEVEAGKETAFFQDLIDLKAAIPKTIDLIQKTYTQNGKIVEDDMVHLNRVVGTVVSSVLASLNTLGRNWVQSGWAYNGQRIGRLMNSVTLGYRKATWEMTKQAVVAMTYGPLALVLEARKIHGIEAAKHMWKAIVATGMKPFVAAGSIVKPELRKILRSDRLRISRHVMRAQAEILGDWVQGWSESMWKLSKHYDEMRQRGMLLPMNLREALIAISNDPDNYGKINPRDSKNYGQNRVWKLLSFTGVPWLFRQFLGSWEFYAQTARAALPRMGDGGANIAGFNAALSAVKHLESHLRLRWHKIRESGMRTGPIQLGETITPGDLVPAWFGEGSNPDSMAMIMKWFDHAGVDVRTTINDFWRKLDAASTEEQRKAVSWLSQEQEFNLAQSHVEDMNMPSPTNRPLAARLNVLTRVVYALFGWRLNMFSLQTQLFGGSAVDKVPKLNIKTGEMSTDNLKVMANMERVWFWLATFVLGGMAGQGLYEEFARIASRFLMGGEQRSTNQLWETLSVPENAVRQSIADATTIIPFLDMIGNQLAVDPSGRRKSLRFSQPFVIQNQVNNVEGYLQGVINTGGDFSYNADGLARSLLPVTKVAINNMPQFSGRVKHVNSVRLISRAAERHMLKERSISGHAVGELATPLTPYTGRMINAALNDDYVTLTSVFNEAVEVAVQTRGLSYADAVKLVRDNYRRQNPWQRALKSLPSKQDRMAMLDRLSDIQRVEVLGNEELYRRGAEVIGARVNFTEEESSAASTRRTPPVVYDRLMRLNATGATNRLGYLEAYQKRMQSRLTPAASRLR